MFDVVFWHVVVGFWQYEYVRNVLYVKCCSDLSFAHSFGTDVRLFDLILYSAHVYTFYVVLGILPLVFGNNDRMNVLYSAHV